MGTGEVASTGIQAVMDSAIVTYLIKIVGAIIVIFILLMVSKVLAKIISKKIVKTTTEGNKHADKIEKLVHDIVFYVLVIFSFFVGFEIVGFNVGLIIWGISFGVGLAFKEILGNMIAGIMIMYTKEFKLGDIVEITADQVYFGRIEEITIRYTIIRTLDLRQVVLPNILLISTPIKTFSSEDLVKLTAVFGVHYNSNIEQVLQVVTQTINALPYVKEKENTKTFVSSFADSYIEIKSFFYFDPKCGMIPEIALWEINNAMNTAFIQYKIEVPFNTLTVNFESNQDKAKLEANIAPTANQPIA